VMMSVDCDFDKSVVAAIAVLPSDPQRSPSDPVTCFLPAIYVHQSSHIGKMNRAIIYFRIKFLAVTVSKASNVSQ